MDRYSLKWRIFAYLLGFCVMLMIVLWIFQTVLLTEMYKFIRKTEIDKAVELVGRNIDNPDLQSILVDLELNNEIIVVPAVEFSPSQRYADNRGRPLPESITQTNEFTLSDGHQMALTFHAMISPVAATVSTLKLQLYLVTVIMVVLAVIIAVIISKRISRPIEDINKSAKALAAGDYEVCFSGRGFLEIRELSNTLNTTALELSKAETQRRELMANISHDLRTPLALIYSYAEMMHDFPDEITLEQTQTIMDETRRLALLVSDILDVSRLETGTVSLNRSVYSLTKCVSSTVDRMAELCKKDGYSLVFEHEGEAFVNADEVKITQVIYNLLANAVHYGGTDKQVIIRQIISGGRVKIEVADNGEGIAAEDLRYIWDRYYKVDKQHRRAIAGVGLGLSIVKKIIKLHDGDCGVGSELGKGSVFWFALDIHLPSNPSAAV